MLTLFVACFLWITSSVITFLFERLHNFRNYDWLDIEADSNKDSNYFIRFTKSYCVEVLKCNILFIEFGW